MSLDLSAAATSILKSLGSIGHAKLVKSTGGTFDPIVGETVGQVKTTYTPPAAVLSPDDRQIDGTTILATDKRVIFDNSVTVEQSDLIIIGGLEYRIIQIGGENPNGVQQYWDIICRG